MPKGSHPLFERVHVHPARALACHRHVVGLGEVTDLDVSLQHLLTLRQHEVNHALEVGVTLLENILDRAGRHETIQVFLDQASHVRCTLDAQEVRSGLTHLLLLRVVRALSFHFRSDFSLDLVSPLGDTLWSRRHILAPCLQAALHGPTVVVVGFVDRSFPHLALAGHERLRLPDLASKDAVDE